MLSLDIKITHIIVLDKEIMANKRDLKKSINYICSELFAETMAASIYGTNENQENIEALLTSIMVIDSDFIGRVSHVEPGIKPKRYYKKLVEDFNKQMNETIDRIAALG